MSNTMASVYTHNPADDKKLAGAGKRVVRQHKTVKQYTELPWSPAMHQESTHDQQSSFDFKFTDDDIVRYAGTHRAIATDLDLECDVTQCRRADRAQYAAYRVLPTSPWAVSDAASDSDCQAETFPSHLSAKENHYAFAGSHIVLPDTRNGGSVRK